MRQSIVLCVTISNLDVWLEAGQFFSGPPTCEVLTEWEWDTEGSQAQLRVVGLNLAEEVMIGFERLHHQRGDDWARVGDASRQSRFQVIEESVTSFAELADQLHDLSMGFDVLGVEHTRPTLAEKVGPAAVPTFADVGLVPGACIGLTDGTQDKGLVDLAPRLVVWDKLTTQIRNALVTVFASIRYLGPLRALPDELVAIRGVSARYLGAAGEQTGQALAAKPELIEEVNAWFSRFSIPYQLEFSVAVFGDDEDGPQAGMLLLRHSSSGTLVSMRQVGFGIGQVMPVLVQSLLSVDDLIVIEQPELHLHPALQSELGDLFINACNERGNRFLIETHSEHLLMRLGRRIREGAIPPDFVKVIYVDTRADGTAAIRELSLDEDGALIDGWPGGFFDQDLTEIFGESL
jgi:hypothetical protein